MLYKDIYILESETIKSAFDRLNKTAKKILLVVDDKEKLLGTLSDGDLRRYVLTKGKDSKGNIDFNKIIRGIYNKKPKFFISKKFSLDAAAKVFAKHKVELIPVVNKKGVIVDCITWDQLFMEYRKKDIGVHYDVPVVIMAGGKGTRMDPFTRILPKALVPVGTKPVIETIIDEFRAQGISEYYVTLNYKADMIKIYFNSAYKDYRIHFVKEENFLGTAGSLGYFKDKISETFIVSNCDSIVKFDLAKAIEKHKAKGSCLTMVASLQTHKIPYGVINSDKNNNVRSVTEKPEYTVNVNTGVYILSKNALDHVKKNKFLDMTKLIERLLKNKKRVSVYQVSSDDYIDIGQWEDYKKVIQAFSV